MPFRHLPRLFLGLLLASLPHLAAADPIPLPGGEALTSVLLPDDPAWAGNHPRIVFTAGARARIQGRIQGDPEVAEAWEKIKMQCERYLDPKSPDFLDETKAYKNYLDLRGEGRSKQSALEAAARQWLTPLDLLSFAYAVSGDERYGRKAAALAVVTAQRLSPSAMAGGFFYTCSFPTRSLALALDWCYPLFSGEERRTVRQSLAVFTNALYLESLKNLWGQSTLGRIWNWNAGIAAAWGLGALAIEGETNYPARQWIFQAERNVEDYLRFGVDEQGGVVEGPLYFGYGAGPMPYFVEGLKARTGDDLYAATHYRLLASWLPLEMLPGGHRVNNLLDSGYRFGITDPLIYALHREEDRPLARYLWEQLFLRSGEVSSWPATVLWAPEPLPAADMAARAARLPDYGWAGGRSLVVSRSGTGAQDAYFSIHAQHYTEIRHDQADKGEFTLYAYGDDLAIDSGYGNDGSTEGSTSGYAHNQVLVDGKPEIQGGHHAQTDGWIIDSLHAPLVDLTVLDIGDAYRFFYKIAGNDPTYQKESVQGFEKAGRLALFVRAPFPYAVVFDDMKKDDAPHDYTWLLHSPSGKAFEGDDAGIRVVPSDTGSPLVVTHPLAPDAENPVDSKNVDKAVWKVALQVAKAGKYQVWGLTGTESPDGDKSNSFFLRINHGKQGFPRGSLKDRFIWETLAKAPLRWAPLNDDNGGIEVPALPFGSGPVDFELSSRELGADCAALALVPEGAKVLNGRLPEGSIAVAAKDGTISGEMRRQTVTPPRQGAWLQIGLVAPVRWEKKDDAFETTDEGSHARLSVTTHAVRGQFLTLLIPHPVVDAKLAPSSRVEMVPATKGHAGRVMVADGITDLVACWDGSGIETDNVKTDADFLWLRRDAAGKIIAVAVADASRVVIGGREVFTCDSGKSSFVVSDGKAFFPEGAAVKFDLDNVVVKAVERPGDWMAVPPGHGSIPRKKSEGTE